MSDEKNPKAATEPRLIEARVARGRTVVDATGASRKPGEVAKLSAKDVKRLRELGYLLSDEKEPPLEGPRITSSDGPSVKQVG